jgi:hypothetical protein
VVLNVYLLSRIREYVSDYILFYTHFLSVILFFSAYFYFLVYAFRSVLVCSFFYVVVYAYPYFYAETLEVFNYISLRNSALYFGIAVVLYVMGIILNYRYDVYW